MKSHTSLLRYLLVILIVISISSNVVAINVDDDNTEIKYDQEYEKTTVDDLEDVVDLTGEQRMGITDEGLEIKEINPDEIFNYVPGISTDEKNILKSFENVKLKRDLTVPYSDNFAEMIIPPEEMYDFGDDSTASEPETESEQYTNSMVISSAGNNRADAGDDFGHADALTDGGNWMNDTVKTQWNSGSNQWEILDVDCFYIAVQEKGNLETEYIEIEFENTRAPKNQSTRALIGRIYDPISLYLHQNTMILPGDYQGKTIAKSDSDIGITSLDLEILFPQESGTLSAAPPVSGVLFLEIYCIANMEIGYNITSVKKSVVKPVTNPYDKNNYPHNATVPQSKTGFSGTLLQNKDHWDWYDISSYLTYIGDQWPNEISYDIDITRTNSASGSYHTWTSVWLLYDSLDQNTLYLNGDEMDTGGSDTIQVGGVPSEPIKTKIERYTSHIWLGIRSYSVGIDNGQMFPQVYDGGCDYTVTKFDIVVKNSQPLLTTGKLEPAQDYYFMDDTLQFSVRYRDYDNDAPQYVRVTIDGENYEMKSSGTNYVTGVSYTFSIKGSELTDSFYPHTFNFSASDGLLFDSMSLSPPKNQFKVIEDQTPGIWNSAPKKLTFDEDDDPYTLSCEDIFIDVDPPDGLTYTIWNDNSYGQKYESSRLEVFLINKKNLKIQLKPDQHGTDEILVRAKEGLKISTDIYEFYAAYKFNITITSVEDKPVLNPIGKIHGYQDEPIYIQISAVDADIITDNDELTFTTNRSDGKGPDDLEGFKVVPDPMSLTKANISFNPTNANVGTFLVEITVTDTDENQDTRDVEFEIANVNDPPVITQVMKGIMKKDTTELTEIEMNAVEDEWFNISVESTDLDVLIGMSNDILYKLENHTFGNVVNLQHTKGSLTANFGVLPLNSDVGNNFINFSVHDGKGGSDYLSIKINVENSNDPPNVPEIIKPEENTFSIVDDVMFVGKSDDIDLYIPNSKEVLTYKWYLKIGSTWTELRNTEPYDRVSIDFPTPFLPFNDDEIEPGNYTIKFEVTDSEGESRYVEFNFRLLLDYDNDEMDDDWEEKYDLDPHNREDAFSDSDKDGYINIKEHEAMTNPRDPNDKPAEKSSDTTDYTIYFGIVAVVIVIIVLLVLFLIVRNRRKLKDDLQNLDDLAYPEEETTDDLDHIKLDGSKGTGPGVGGVVSPGGPGMGAGAGVGGAGAGAGAGPGFMQPPPGVSPEMHMQIMKMMQAKQMQMQAQQKAGQGPGTTGQSGGLGPKPVSTSSALGTGSGTSAPSHPPSLGTGTGGPNLVPKLPPPRFNQQPTQGPAFNSTSASGKADNITEGGIKNSVGNGNGTGMKCPNCGITVQSGWFLCPACKSPLN